MGSCALGRPLGFDGSTEVNLKSFPLNPLDDDDGTAGVLTGVDVLGFRDGVG